MTYNFIEFALKLVSVTVEDVPSAEVTVLSVPQLNLRLYVPTGRFRNVDEPNN